MSGDAEPLCDRISHIAAELENSAGDLRGMPGVSRLRAALPAAVAALRHIADQVLEQGVELDELERLRAEREADDSGAVWLAERNEELRNAVMVAAEMLHRFAAETPCTEGGDTCREHGYARKPCLHTLARQFVTAWRAVQAESAPQQPERGGEAPCNPECREAHAGQPH